MNSPGFSTQGTKIKVRYMHIYEVLKITQERVNLIRVRPTGCYPMDASVYIDLQLRKMNFSLLFRYSEEKLKV